MPVLVSVGVFDRRDALYDDGELEEVVGIDVDVVNNVHDLAEVAVRGHDRETGQNVRQDNESKKEHD